MSGAFLQLLPLCLGLFLLQGLAAIPWLVVLSRVPFRDRLSFYAKLVGITTGCGVIFAFLLNANSDPGLVSLWGRFYSSILTLQIGLDLFVLTFYLMLTFWSKAGAVALAAFQEGVRQP